jgi:hypothetical protein
MLTVGTIGTILLVGKVAAPFVPLIEQQVGFFQYQIVTAQMMRAMRPKTTIIYRCCCGKHKSLKRK